MAAAAPFGLSKNSRGFGGRNAVRKGRAASARGAFLALPCSLGFRLAFSATGGARLPPPWPAFEKAGENQLVNFFGFPAECAGPPLIGSGGLVWPAKSGAGKWALYSEGWKEPQRSRGGGGRAQRAQSRGGGLWPPPMLWLSKKWLAPLFRGFHSSLAPTARPGSYAEKPLLRKAFCGFAVHAAKSDYSLRGLRPPSPQGFLDKLGLRGRPPPRRWEQARQGP